MSAPLQFTYESTPALWRCNWDPEGPEGFGKTKDEALFDLWLSCDGEEEPLMKAIVAALERLESQVKAGDALARSVDEALNMGDGSYRP